MAHISYIGRNGGQNADLEAAKTEALQLANELTRAKLDKLRGTVVEKRVVEFVLGQALMTLREQILRLPNLVAAELRGFDHIKVHAIRVRIDDAVRRSLDELGETLAKAVAADDFLAGLPDDDESVDESDEMKAASERKRNAANATRREKRPGKKAK
jgi:hypothetical protein